MNAAERHEAIHNAAEKACPHGTHIVRISCHEDLMSSECAQHPQMSILVCGHPTCKGRAMQAVWAATHCPPVTVKKKGKAA